MVMTAELIQILSQYGKETVSAIQSNLASTGTNATGKTSQSVRYEIKQEGTKTTLKLVGKPFIAVVETGRKPTPEYKPSEAFVESIQEWMNAKGVDGSAYGIAQAIHKEGTKLFRDGGRKDIISNVINQNLIDRISNDLLVKFAQQFLQSVIQVWR